MKKSRLAVLSMLARVRQASRYLEIGYENSDTVFSAIPCSVRVGVDPHPKKSDPDAGTLLRVTSDEFFNYCTGTFDLIFIDGEHTAEQVHKDAMNAMSMLRPGGAIVLHDCYPPDESYATPKCIRPDGGWCGTVWKGWLHLVNEVLKAPTVGGLRFFPVCVDVDYGCGVLLTVSEASLAALRAHVRAEKHEDAMRGYDWTLLAYREMPGLIGHVISWFEWQRIVWATTDTITGAP